MLWLPWSQFAWSANAVPGNSRTVRVLFLVATAASVPMAASIQTAFDQSGALFAIPLAVIFLTALAMLVVGLDSATKAYRSALRYSAPNIVAMAIIVTGGFIDGDGRRIAWIAGILVFIFATIQAGGGEWIVRAGHFAERHGLIIIVALGEVIVALRNALRRFARDVYSHAHAPIVAGIILSAVAMEEMALHPSDPLPAAFRAMGAAGILFYFGGVGIGV